MRFHYILYQDALDKLRTSGIEGRVQELKESEEGLPRTWAHVSKSDVRETVSDLKNRGFYTHLPANFAPKYREAMNAMLNCPNDFSWKIERSAGIQTEPCDLEDMLLFAGDFASVILTPDEIWDYKKFGFSSPSEFVTTVGAYIVQQSRESLSLEDGYRWTTNRPDGSEIVSVVTGNSHADLLVLQTDIAPYKTTDPFGNTIFMRPESDADRHTISAYHSTEATMLVAVMKYIEQQGVQAGYQKDSAQQLIRWGNSLGQRIGNTAEHLGGFEQDAPLFFIGYDRPIPQLNNNNETNQHTNFWVGTDGESAFGVYVGQNGDLVFSHERWDKKIDTKTIAARFLPEDAEHLVKGLIYQAANGLGRTPATHLLEILDYRYSPEFEIDQKKYG